MYLRRNQSAAPRISVSVDESPRKWKKHLSETELAQFVATRHSIWSRVPSYVPALAEAIATAYKLGDPFPSHYDFGEHAFTLEMPKAFAELKRKTPNAIKDFLWGMVKRGEMDRFGMLVVGLAMAGKVPHWSGYVDGKPPHDAWSETEAEDDESPAPWIPDDDDDGVAVPLPLPMEAMWRDFVASQERLARDRRRSPSPLRRSPAGAKRRVPSPPRQRKKKMSRRRNPSPKRKNSHTAPFAFPDLYRVVKADLPTSRRPSPRWTATTHTSDVDASLFDALNWQHVSR